MEPFCVHLYRTMAVCPDFQEGVDLFFCNNAVGIIDIAVSSGNSHRESTERGGLFDHAPGCVTVAGYRNALALDRIVFVMEHFLQEGDCTVAGRFRTEQGTAVGRILSGQYTVLPGAGQPAVLSVQPADLLGTDADITGRYIYFRSDMPVQLRHECLAETHDFTVALSCGSEIAASFSAAHRQTGQGILERLFEAKELQGSQGQILRKAQTAFVWSDGAVELYPPAAVDLRLSVIVHPYNPERDDAVRFDHTLQQRMIPVFRMSVQYRTDGSEDFLYGLVELGLIRVSFPELGQGLINIIVHSNQMR